MQRLIGFLAPCLHLRFWLVAVLFFKLALIFEIYRNRDLPMEVDDTYSYVLHARTLADDPKHVSPALSSVSQLSKHAHPANLKEARENRLYHRILNYYHSGHAIFLRLLSGLTKNYEWAWYLSTVFLIVAYTVCCYQLAKLLPSTAGPIFFLASSFSFLDISHQITAAPREWCALFFLVLTLIVIRVGDKVRWYWVPILFVLVFALLTFHPVGLVSLAVLCVFLASRMLWAKNFGLQGRGSSFQLILILLISGAVSQYLVKLLFPHNPPTPTEIYAPEFRRLLRVYWQEWLVSYVRTLSLPQFLAAFFLLAVIYELYKLYKGRAFQWLFLFTFTTGAAWALALYGQPYLPPNEYYYFHSYFFTVSYAFLSVIFSLAAYRFFQRRFFQSRFYRWGDAGKLIIAFYIFLGGVFSSVKFAQYWIRRQNYQGLETVVAAVEKNLVEGDCIEVYDENLLYYYMSYGSLKYPIQAHVGCGPDELIVPAAGQLSCRYRLRLIQNNPCNEDKYTILQEQTSVVLERKL